MAGRVIGRILRLLEPARPESKRAEAGRIEVCHGGETFPIELRRSPNARRLILRVRGATRDAVLTIPKRTSLADARSFAQRQAAWLGARLRRLPEPIRFIPGAVIPVRGVPTSIVSRPHERGVAWVETDTAGQQSLNVAGDPAHLSRRTLDFLRRECRRDLETAVAAAAAQVGRRPPPLTLRDTASRWGSCTAAGRLNFSWRLILAPPFVLEYLAAHEVAHLVHMNHSDRFWAVCRQLNADTDRAEAWLNAHGVGLHRYRIADTAA